MGYIGAGPTRFNTADELTVTGDAEITGAITTDGMTTTADVTFGDNDKAIFGAGSDLQISHDGSASIIYDNGTGPLNLQTNNSNINIKGGGSASDTMAIFKSTEGVDLYYNNVKKFETTATGVDVTGTVTADGLTVDTDTLYVDSTNNRVGIGTTAPAQSLHIENTSASVRQRFVTGTTNQVSIDFGDTDSGAVGRIEYDHFTDAMAFRTNASERLRIDSSGNLLVGTTTASGNKFKVERTDSDNAIAEFKTNNANGDVIIRSSGGYGRVRAAGTNELAFLNAGTEAMRIDSSGNVGIGTTSLAHKLSIQTNANIHLGYNGTSANTEVGRISSNSYAVNNESYSLAEINFITSSANGYTGDIQFRTNSVNSTNTRATERMRIDSSGNVGIKTSSPEQALHINGFLLFNNNHEIRFKDSGGSQRTAVAMSSNDLNIGTSAGGNLKFYNGSSYTERMRITSDGSLFYGTTSNVGTGSLGVAIDAGDNFMIRHGISGTATQDRMRFYNSNGLMGWIQTTGSACTYNSASDYRLKENVTADWDATTRLKQLNPVRFNFTFEPDTTVDGFLAHEVQDIVPEAVSGTHNGMRDEEYEVTPAVLDEDGNEVTPAVMGTRSVPDLQGIDQSKLVPLLCKTILELEARIVALETA